MSNRRPFYAHGLFVTVHAPVPYSTPAKFWYRDRDRHIDAVQISVEHHEPAYWIRLASTEDETKEDVTDFKDWIGPFTTYQLQVYCEKNGY